jgi:peroxiredoxin
VIAPDGTIKDILRKVKPAQHDDLVLAAIGQS